MGSNRLRTLAAGALLAALAAACREPPAEHLAEERAELERTQRDTREELGPAPSPEERQQALEELREERQDVAQAVEQLHDFQEPGGPVAGTDIVRGTVTDVAPGTIRIRTESEELALVFPGTATIRSAAGHELARDLVVEGAEVRAVFHAGEEGAGVVDELWVAAVPGQENLPSNVPMNPPLPAPELEPGSREPPALPGGDRGGKVPGS